MLSATKYKPVRCARSLDELAQANDFDAKGALFIVGWDCGSRGASGGSALNEVSRLRQRYAEANIIVMSAVCDFDGVVASLHAGADGYALSSMTCEMLTKSFDLIMAGETVLPSEFIRAFSMAKANPPPAVAAPVAHVADRAAMSERPHLPKEVHEMRKLSGRELAIMSRLREGDSNKIIARRIGLAEATVKTHVKAILRKVGVKNRTQAALWAIANLGTSDVVDDVIEDFPEPTHHSNGAANGQHAAVPHQNGRAAEQLALPSSHRRSRAAVE